MNQNWINKLFYGVSVPILQGCSGSGAGTATIHGSPAIALAERPNSKWVGTWATANYAIEDSNLPPDPGLSGNTLRQVVRVSIGGKQIRLKFSNRCGTAPLEMKAVHLAVSTGRGSIDTATGIKVTFGGNDAVIIPKGQTVTSDPLDYPLSTLTNLAITIHFGHVPNTVIGTTLDGKPLYDLTGHPGSRTTSYLKEGNEVAVADMVSAVTLEHWYVIEGIDVYAEETFKAVVVLGDSITDGYGVTTDAQNRWTDHLAARLQANPATSTVGVLNQGIGATMVTESGVARFERDVLDRSGVRYLVVLYGINDIIYMGKTATDIIAVYQHFIRKAHGQNMLVYGGTILPFGGFSEYTAARETVRQQVNKWMRSTHATAGGFNSVIDFDAALRDAAIPTELAKVYDCGDGLHPGPAGYQKMADAIELNLFIK